MMCLIKYKNAILNLEFQFISFIFIEYIFIGHQYDIIQMGIVSNIMIRALLKLFLDYS